MIETPDLLVHPALQPYIRAIRVEETSSRTRQYKVLPSPAPVAGFQSRGRLRVLRQDSERFLDPCGITGLQSTARTFEAQEDTHTILVVFEPFGVFALLGCPMNELVDTHLGFQAVGPPRHSREVSDRLREARSNREKSAIVQSFFLRQLESVRQRPHALIQQAARQIAACHGRERIEDLARDLGVSRRHLERLFLRQIGVGPKEFASLTRFDWLMNQLPRRRSWADLAYEAGFADQAHFVRHFITRTGVRPEEHVRLLSSA